MDTVGTAMAEGQGRTWGEEAEAQDDGPGHSGHWLISADA